MQVPILGICVGLQVMGDGSEEGELSGFGWIPGKVKNLMKIKFYLSLNYHTWAE